MISDFTLPSDPTRVVRLRECNVQEAIDFADVNADCEEQITSLFLNKMQDSGTYTDPRKWTGEDRRFALFWYYVHTAKDTVIPITFDCPQCKEKHTVAYDLRDLEGGYQVLHGRAQREIEHEGVQYIVRPLNGYNLEELELMQIGLNVAIEEHGAKSGAVRKQASRIRFTRFMLSLEMVGAEGDNEEAKRKALEKKLLSMTDISFGSLVELVEKALDEMTHGLLSVYENGGICLFTSEIECTKHKGEPDVKKIRLRLPFWAFDYIPKI